MEGNSSQPSSVSSFRSSTRRGRGLQSRRIQRSESGFAGSIETDSQSRVTKITTSCSSLTLSHDGETPSASQVGRDTGNESAPSPSRAESSIMGEDFETQLDNTRAQGDRKEDVKEAEEERYDTINEFSNINCLYFWTGEMRKVYEYRVQFTPDDMYPLDKELLFQLTAIKADLKVDGLLFKSPDTLYTSGKLPDNKGEITSKLHGKDVTIKISEPLAVVDACGFFGALLYKVSLIAPLSKDFVPLQLVPSEERFERFPGTVLDVLDGGQPNQTIVRCSSRQGSFGTVRDIISECMLYTIMRKSPKDDYYELVERCLNDLVVLTEVEQMTMIIKRVIWEDSVPADPGRDRFFAKRGIKRGKGPQLLCKYLNRENSCYMEPENLNVVGSRRVGASHPAVRRDTEGGADRVTYFLGQAVSGQQRQLALLRFQMAAKRERISNEFSRWGVRLIDTAVLSNGVLLQTDKVLFMGDGHVTDVNTTGWLNRLSDVHVHTPVCIRNWVIIAQHGDETIVNAMMDNLVNDAPKVGIEMHRALFIRWLPDDKAQTYVDALAGAVAKRKNLQLAVVVVRTSRDDIYRAVKRWSLGSPTGPQVATQVLIRDTAHAIANRLEVSLSVITQINCKLGGDLWTLDGRLIDTMVIGLSSYIGESGNPFIGFVSSKNRLFSSWFSGAMNDEKKFRYYLKKASHKYQEMNGNKPPKTVVVFRHRMDPFSPAELEDLRAVFGHNASLVVLSLLDGEQLMSMVQDIVAKDQSIKALEMLHRRIIYVAQRKGIPTDSLAFQLEVNTAKMPLQEIAKIIKQLKHMYFNVAGETPLPAPLLYAGKCAEFVSDVLDGQTNPAFEDVLFYL